ncbi:MAG: ExbD/TolR family protein [Alkalilacustris sp.]
MTGGFDLGPRRRGRRPSLTPMIDVVFLLLVFFMLAARFGLEARVPLLLASEGPAVSWSGPPRLVEVLADGQRLNGVALELPELLVRLSALVTEDGDPVVLRPGAGASVQRLVEVMAALETAGHRRLVVVE